MKLIAHLSNLWHPAEMQDLNIQEVLAGLADPSVRKHWLYALMDEIKNINKRTHKALLEGKLEEKFVQESVRLQGIEYVLRQVLQSKNSVELDKRSNHIQDEPGVAVLPAP